METCPWRGGDKSITHTHTHICKHAGTRSPADRGEHAHGVEVINQSHTHTNTCAHTRISANTQVPDRQLIMENMLMAEGFVEAAVLSKKFAALYQLLEDLLSPQK